MTLIPTQITFHGLAHSDAIEADILERVAWLEQYHHGIVGCKVRVEVPHRHRQGGKHVQIRIEVTVPGAPPILVSHEPSLHAPLKDMEEPAHRKETEVEAEHRYARVAVHDAFTTARRRLQDLTREQRGAVKTHEAPAHGEVAEIFAIDGYGFIQAGERRVYFSRNSVLNNGFERLEVGTAVAFVEEQGEKGPQASTVHVLGRHHYATPDNG